MSNRTVIRTVITPRAITRRVGPAGVDGAGGGATTFAALTDKATADLPAINTPLASALSGKQPLDADLTAIAALTTTANGRALLTSPNALSIGTSAYVSGSNTGDNAVNIRYSGLVTNATHTGDVTGSTELTLATVNPNVGAWGASSLTPTFTVDEKGRITEAGQQQTQVSVYNVFDMGGGVSTALSIGVDTYGGFLTAGIGDTLPIERGGTGATTASAARFALNGGAATGDALFTAATPAAARTTLGIISRVTTADVFATSTTPVAIPELTFPVEANKLYKIDFGFAMQSWAASGYQVTMNHPNLSRTGNGYSQILHSLNVKLVTLGATSTLLNRDTAGNPNGTMGMTGYAYIRPTASGNVTFTTSHQSAGSTLSIGPLAGSGVLVTQL